MESPDELGFKRTNTTGTSNPHKTCLLAALPKRQSKGGSFISSAAACYALKSLLGQLRKVFGRIGFKLLDAGFAAEFDLLTFIDLGDRLAHAAEFIPADKTGFEWIGFHAGCAEAKSEQGGGDESGEFGFHDGV